MESRNRTLFMWCLLALVLPGIASAQPLVMIEPLTGSRITLPAMFPADTEPMNAAGQFGKVHAWMVNARQPDEAEVSVAVNEVGARSINDVLDKILFSPEAVEDYVIRELSANHLMLDEVHDFMGEKTYLRHLAWLLEDGSYLYVEFQTRSEEQSRAADELRVEFGAVTGTAGLKLMTALAPAQDDPDSIVGAWRQQETGTLLEVYGKNLFSLTSSDGDSLARGYHSERWGECVLWGAASGNCSLRKDKSSGLLVLADTQQFDGNYARVATPDSARLSGDQPPADEFRGEWENDNKFMHMKITRASVTLEDGSSLKVMGGYRKNADGLQISDDVGIRKTADGGLVMDGIDGVFYRVGEGKGVSRDAQFAAYRGNWINHTTSMSISVGTGSLMRVQGNSVGAGSCSVDASGDLIALGSRGHIDPDSGALIFEGIEGEFIREQHPDSGSSAPVADGVYRLSAGDADLELAPDVILEGAPQARNLGGWRQRGDNRVRFPVHVQEAGHYRVDLLCSREPAGNALVAVSVGEDDGVRVLIGNTGNWSQYRTFASTSLLSLPAGDSVLFVQSADDSRGEHLMNLRALTLTLEP